MEALVAPSSTNGCDALTLGEESAGLLRPAELDFRFLPDGLTIRTFDPVRSHAFVIRSYEEVVQMEAAYALAGWVREWTREQCPGEPRVPDMAVSVALSSFFGGASVAEACEQARSFVVSRTVHPAHRGNRQVAALSFAS